MGTIEIIEIIETIEIIGISIAIIGLLLLISLISFSPDDPNFIFPKGTNIKNLLGFRGCFTADLFFQSFGIRLSINLRAVAKVDSRSLPPVAPRSNLTLSNPRYPV